RWKKNTYVPYEFTEKDSALNIILTERRKELVFRGLRWPDLKRLNRDGANITLTRKVDGEMHTLPPNDPRYAIAIPEEVIELSDILPNPR
ncbi:MAG: RagB/SusD family nutrient uptake outer membrane protein, partial [Leadbetterella sp.]|nr:RagB/SusD family nutrient uptake outer membrane protein [Leadbetterella sp.]